MFYEQIQELACRIKEEDVIEALLKNAKKFQDEAKELLEQEIVKSEKLKTLIHDGSFLNVELPELLVLKEVNCLYFHYYLLF